MDTNTDESNLEYMRSLGAHIYKTNLSEKALLPDDVLKLTDNINGFDITSNIGFDPAMDSAYDWFALEMLNENPNYIFGPDGTGETLMNLIQVMRNLCCGERKYPEYRGNYETTNITVIGATTNNPSTRAEKIYAPFRPWTSVDNRTLRMFDKRGWIGKNSRIVEFSEESLIEAEKIYEENQVVAEPSGAGSLAALHEIKDEISQDAKIIVVNTGKARLPKQ